SSIGRRPLTSSAPSSSGFTWGSSRSYSSAISPTISSSRSSSVTSPSVSPYSSTTIAMCVFFACISRSSSDTFFDSGTNIALRRRSFSFFDSRLPLRPARAVQPPHHVLRINQSDDLVHVVVFPDRHPREALLEHELEHIVQRRRDVDSDDVGPRNHDFAYDGVAELEDRMDHLFLFFFDSGLFRRNLRHRSYLGLRDERTAFHPFAWRHDVRDDNETADQRVQTRNTRQAHDDRCDTKCDLLGVLDRVRLRRGFREHEDQERHPERRDDPSVAVRDVVRE